MSSSSRVPRAQPEPEKDWEDEYRRLRQQHNELKVLCNEQEEHIRKLQAKTRKLESDFSILRGGGVVKSNPVDKDEENLVAALSNQNTKLKHQHGVIIEKNKQLLELLEKRKREINSLKRSHLVRGKPISAAQASKENFLPHEVEIRAAATHFAERDTNVSMMSELKPPSSSAITSLSVAAAAAADSNLLEIARKYKTRINSCEEQIANLKDENSKLRMEVSSSTSRNNNANNGNLESQLRDASWRLQQLQTQYDFLASKSFTQGNAVKDAEEKAEDSAQKVRDLRRALEELRHEKESTDAKAVRADELEETVRELRQGNRGLEDKIARLCEVPFINGAFGQQDARAKFEDVAREKEDYKSKMNHLQEAVRTHFSSLTSLKQQAAQYRQEKESAETRAEELRLKFHELTANSSLMQDKLQLYSGDDGVDMETLERALTLIKRRGEGLKTRPFRGDDAGEDLVMLPEVKRKLEEVQVMNLKLTDEVEKLETMLKLQSSINKDLHQELESLTYKRDKDKNELIERADDYEQMAMKRLEKIHSLEAQVRQFVYGVAQKRTKAGLPYATGGPLLLDASLASQLEGSEFDSENALLSELIDERGGDLNPDENLLEVWVKSAVVKEGITGPGSSTFVVVDFFDYESQTTSLLSGNKPAWDFATTFKIIVDDFLLRYLATDVVTLELNMACQGDFSMLARCAIPLGALLRSKPMIKLINQPLLSVRTGEVVAHLSVEIRLAIPVSELYRLFLQRHPAEKQLIEDMCTKRTLEAVGDLDRAKNVDAVRVGTTGEDESRLYNELEVAILRATSLPLGADNRHPTAYVHFQLLGHPDKLTNPIPNNRDPNFNERFVFPMVTNDQQLRLLLRSRLQVSVVDMHGEEAEDPSEGLLGEIHLPLKEIADGIPIMDIFPLKNDDGRPAGSLQISIRWKHPFKRCRELGPRSLSATEVENLMSAFSAGESFEGLISYKDFCRFVDPPRNVSRTMDQLRTYSQKMFEKENFKSRELFRILFDLKTAEETFTEESFIQRALRSQLDCVPADYGSLFRFIDTDEDGLVTLNQFLVVLNLEECNGLSAVLQDKMKSRVKELNDRKIPILKMFQEADQWGAEAHVSRMEFKGVLKKMGFFLVDEPEPVSVSTVKRDPQGDKLSKNEIYSVPEGEDDVLVQTGVGGAQAGGFNRDQREIFETRRLELVALGKREAALRAQRSAAENRENSGAGKAGSEKGTRAGTAGGGPGPSGQKAETVILSKNALDNDASLEGYSLTDPGDGFSGQHRSKVSSQGQKSSLKILDGDALNKTATKLQSQFRGYTTRKSLSPGNTLELSKASRDDSNDPLMTAGNLSGVLMAEQTIRNSLKSLEGVQAPPDILAGFQTVDTKRTGVVNRMQFAHVLQQMSAIKLYGIELRACMDYFDPSGDGTRIDYNAFCRLCRYKEPDGLPQVQRLRKMILGHESLAVFRGLDPVGSGYIRRTDMLRALAELGHNQIPQPALLAMMELFETRQAGQVNYLNFLEYVRECGSSSALDTLTKQFHSLIMTPNGPAGTQRETNKRWFREIDREGLGKFNINQLTSFLREYDMPATTEAIRVLFLSMNTSSYGVMLSDFEQWIKDAKVSPTGDQAVYCNSPLGELQHKAHIYMLAVAGANKSAGFTLEDVAQSYAVYDWKKSSTGVVPDVMFMKATKRAGFVFTNSEIRMLAGHFTSDSQSHCVCYKKFLSWCTPEGKQITSSSMTTAGGASGQKRSTAAIVKHLESSLKRGIDLLTVFGRYDTHSKGRITADEFCAALSDLGISTITQKEALDLADKFKAAAGSFVLYRRIVEELLRLADDLSGAANIDVVDTVRTCLAKARVDVSRLKDTFGYHDRKGLGEVREEDLQIVFEDAGVVLRNPEVQALADRFAVGDKGMVQYFGLLAALEARMREKSIRSEGVLALRPPAMSDELFLSLRSLFETLVIKGVNFRAEFDKFDDAFTGSIFQSDFRDVLQERCRAGLSAQDLDALERTYRDPDDPRKVSHVRMLQAVHPTQAPLSTYDSEEEEQVWILAETLRQKIRRRCDYLTPGELRRPFKHFARNRKDVDKRKDKGKNKEKERTDSGTSTTVSPSDLAIAVRDLGLKISGEQEARLFEIICLSKSAAFTYADFVVFVTDPNCSDVVWKLRRSLARSKVHEKEILGAMTYQDSNNSGFVSAKQFTKATKSCEVDLSDSDVARICLRFDEEQGRRVDISQFMRFVRGEPYNATDNDDEDEDGNQADPGSRSGVRSSNTLEGAESKAWNALKDRAEELLDTGYTGREVFALFDSEGKGTVDVAMLQKGARETGAMMTRAEARGALRRMTLLCGGAVTRDTFFDALDIDLESVRGEGRGRERGSAKEGDRGRGRQDQDSDEDDDDFRGHGRNGGRGSRSDSAAGRGEREDRERVGGGRGASRDVDREKDRARGRDSPVRSSSRSSGFESVIVHLRSEVDLIADDDRDSAPEEVFRKQLNRHALQNDGLLLQKEFERALDRMGVKISQRDIATLFEGMDRRNTGSIDLLSLVEIVYPKGEKREGVRSREGRDGSRGREGGSGSRERRGDRESERDRDRDRDRGEKVELKRNESRIMLRNRQDILQEVLLQMRAVNKERGATLKDLLAEFKRTDIRNEYVLNKSDFIGCLTRFGFRLRKEVERDLADSLINNDREGDRDRDRERGKGSKGIDYNDFISAVKVESEEAAQTQTQGYSDDALDRLKQRMRNDPKNLSGMLELFRSVDRSAEGEVQVDDFETVMDSLGIPLSKEESKKILSSFSRNGRVVRYKDFIRSFGPSEKKERDSDLAAMITDGLRSSRNPTRDISDEFSRFADEDISVSDLKRGFRNLKMAVSDGDILRLLRRLDPRDSGFVKCKEFLDLLDSRNEENENENEREKDRRSEETSRGKGSRGVRGDSKEDERDRDREYRR